LKYFIFTVKNFKNQRAEARIEVKKGKRPSLQIGEPHFFITNQRERLPFGQAFAFLCREGMNIKGDFKFAFPGSTTTTAQSRAKSFQTNILKID